MILLSLIFSFLGMRRSFRRGSNAVVRGIGGRPSMPIHYVKPNKQVLSDARTAAVFEHERLYVFGKDVIFLERNGTEVSAYILFQIIRRRI